MKFRFKTHGKARFLGLELDIGSLKGSMYVLHRRYYIQQQQHKLTKIILELPGVSKMLENGLRG
jgi:hypothetical protein